MNAAHISEAISAMDITLQFIQNLPLMDKDQFSSSVSVTGKLAGASQRLKTELSKINMEVTA